MTTRTLFGFIARETDKALAFVLENESYENVKPLWLPRKKIVDMQELDRMSQQVQLAGESVTRLAIPVEIEADEDFLKRIGVVA